MKNKIKFGISIIIIVLSLNNRWAFAQFIPIVLSLNNSWQNTATPQIGAIAIGTGYSPGTNLPSAFCINGMQTNPTTGNLFRTDGAEAVDNLWQMFTGTGNGVTEKGRIFTTVNWTPPTLNTDFNIKATQGSLFLYGKDANNNGYHIIIDSLNDYMGISPYFGYSTGWFSTSIHPDMPLHIIGDWTNQLTQSEFYAGIHLQNHAALVWDKDGYRKYLFMVHPSFVPAGDFYCGMSDHLGVGSPALWVYRIIGEPKPGILTTSTPPDTGDVEFMSFPTITQTHNVFVDGSLGIGLNTGITPIFYAATNRVEIHTIATMFPHPIAPVTLLPNTSSGYLVPNGHGLGTGFSGLRFTDLRAGSTPYNTNPGTGVLSVDVSGDVIYVPQESFSFFSCGTSVAADKLPNDSWWELMGNNFVFSGTGTANGQNDVGIGTPCSPLRAKLDVYQYANGNTGTRGIRVINMDDGAGTMTPAIGIKAITEGNRTVAGWFEAMSASSGNLYNAIFVPKTGGSTRLGFGAPAAFAGYYLEVQGNALINGIAVPSDLKLKHNFNNFNSGLNVIRNMTTYSYNYNGKAGYDTTKTFIGVIAEELGQIAPYAVDTFYAKLDTDDVASTQLLAVRNEAVMYTAINAIKQLDSSVTVLQNTTPPNMPVLVYPVNGADSIALQVTLTWHGSARATGYTVYINNSMGGSTVVNTTDTFTNVSLQNYYTDFTWYVVANNSAGYSNISAQWSFLTLLPPVPVPPVLIQPYNVATDLPLANTFEWNSSPNASYYILYISTDSSYNNVVSMNYIKDTFALATVPNYSTSYYWWVVAGNVSGQSSESEIWNFSTTNQPPNPPSTPLLATPANGISVVPPATRVIPLVWYKSSGADYYMVFLSLSSNQSGIIEKNMVVDTISYLQLPYDTTYYWWVMAFNKKSGEEATSGVWNFNVTPNPPKQNTEATLSDQTLIKATQESTINNAMQLISLMNPIDFYWDTINNPWLPSSQQMGFIGQQLINIAPQVLFKDSKGYSNVQYGRLSALMIEGMKEQQKQINSKDSINALLNQRIDSLANVDASQNSTIDSLKSVDAGYNTRLDSIEAQIFRCCGSKNAKTVQSGNNNDNSGQNETPSIHNIELANNAILYQNMPNPFGNGTVIKYFVPENEDAQIIFYDEYGNQLKTYTISDKGMGQLNVDASNLSSGLYSYSLVVNGKVIDSKKMVCSK